MNPVVKQAFEEVFGARNGGGLFAVLEQAMHEVTIAEEEIAQARGTNERDPDDPLWQSFMLLHSQVPFTTDRLYRIHCQEILGRVRRGEDTRPGTSAELLQTLSESSLNGPLTSAATCLYMRLFRRLLPDLPEIEEDLERHEALYGDGADRLERTLRRRLRQDERRLKC